MTASELFAEHDGHHCRPPGPVTRFFRRVIAAMRRRLPVPAARPAGTGTALLASPHIPADRFATESLAWAELDAVLGDRMLSEVRAQWNAWHDDDPPAPRRHADLMHAGYARAVDRLRQEAGLPTVAQMHAMRAGSPQWAFPPLEEPTHAEPQPRGPVHDTRMDLAAPHYAPDVPVYGQAPVARVLEAERLGRVMTP